MAEVDGETSKRSLFALIGNLPNLLMELVRGEIESLKQELTAKAKLAGIGIGLLAAAGVFAFFAVLVLIATAILGLATVLPAWAAALIIGLVTLAIAVVLALVGVKKLQKGVPPAPTETIESVKRDVRVIKGTGR